MMSKKIRKFRFLNDTKRFQLIFSVFICSYQKKAVSLRADLLNHTRLS